MNFDNGVDTRSRKWQLTINNPSDNGYPGDYLREIISSLKSLVYSCMSDEIGVEGTPHIHIYIAFSNATRFNSLKKKFPTAHFEIARGTSQQNRDYVFKEGKWLNDKKGETNLRDTHWEYGQLPIDRPGARSDLSDLYDMIKQGMSNYEILESCPQYLFSTDKIDRVRYLVKEEHFKNTFRELNVTYVFGSTGTGKTRGIMDGYGYENVYRVTDYKHPFDSYKGQDVIVYEEFRSSLKIDDMLKYLDGYPVDLPCRYSNKVACFTKVYIVTNIPLNMQYENIQIEYKATWEAFLRRIHNIKEYTSFGVNQYCNCSDYLLQLEIDSIFFKSARIL